jgi:hypothetical protein
VTAPLRLDETARRMVELTGTESQASTFNIWHETQMLSPLDRHLLPLLDGTRERDALLDSALVVVDDNSLGMDRDALAEYVDALPQHLVEMKLALVSGPGQ